MSAPPPPTPLPKEDVVALASGPSKAPSSPQKAVRLVYEDGGNGSKRQAILHATPGKGAASPMKKVSRGRSAFRSRKSPTVSFDPNPASSRRRLTPPHASSTPTNSTTASAMQSSTAPATTPTATTISTPAASTTAVTTSMPKNAVTQVRRFYLLLAVSLFLFTGVRIYRASSIRRQSDNYLIERDDDAPFIAKENNQRPLNIVLLYADDWSYNTLGAMNEYVQTPNLDELARQGMLFTHSCVVTSVCMQSRATLYTGQYSSKHRTLYSRRNITMYEPGKWNKTLYPLMKKAGYHVGFYGKWHHNKPIPGDPFSHGRFYYGRHFVTRDGVERHVTEWNELDALEFLENRPREKPFFLTVSFFATHAIDESKKQYIPTNSSMWIYKEEPVPIPKTMSERHWKDMPHFFNEENLGRSRFRMRYETPEMYQHMMKNTLRMATEVDSACGSILSKLKEQNVFNNTILIFTTDNGNFHGQHGLAEKWYAYEESLRVPLIIKDPRQTDLVGSTNSEFVLNIDLAPTILSAARVPIPNEMQGQDIAPLYLNAKAASKSWRKEFLYEFRDDNPYIPNSMALVQKGFKYIYWEDHAYQQVFDLNADPYEEFDLVNQTDKSLLKELQLKIHEYSKHITK